MANIYINPNYTGGSNNGSIETPWTSWTNFTIANDNTYLMMKNTSENLPDRLSIGTRSNITIGSYGVGEKPKMSCYLTLTDTADFIEVKADNQTEVDNPGDTNVWKFNSGIALYRPHYILGLGSLGDRDNPSWTQRVNYLGQIPGGPDAFTEFGQWETLNGAAAPNEASLFIYSDENPVTKWGTIYYTTSRTTVFTLIACTSITIEDLHFEHAFTGVKAYGNTGTATGIIIQNSVFEHCWDGIRFGDAGALAGCLAQNNDIYVAARVGIYARGDFTGESIIRYNNINNTGYAECIGGIYGKHKGTAGSPLLIHDNNINTVIRGIYWTGEGHGLYSESESEYTEWYNNYVDGCADKAALHINGATTGIKMIGNVVENCKELFNGSDALETGADVDDYELYHNVGYNITNGFNFTRPDTDGTMTVFIHNNICYSDGTGGTGIYVNDSVDDIAGSITEDYNCFYGFARNKYRTDGGALQHPFGSNNITSDPLLDSEYYPTLHSPCIGAGSYLGHFYKDHGNRPFKRSKPSIGAWEVANRDSVIREIR